MVGTNPIRCSDCRQRATYVLSSEIVRGISTRRPSSVDRARDQAGDTMLDKERIDDGDRDRAQQDACHQLSPVEQVAADQLGDDPDRRASIWSTIAGAAPR